MYVPYVCIDRGRVMLLNWRKSILAVVTHAVILQTGEKGMKLVAWKYFSLMMALMLAIGVGAVALTPVPAKAETPPTAEWVKTYGFVGKDSEAKAIAVDSSGNVYITGYSDNGTSSSEDYATIKYSPTGVQLWVARYNGTGSDDDEAAAIALDSSGNAYVTGTSAGSTTNYDYATIKYRSSDGAPLWVSRYDGPAHGLDHAYAIAVDGSGNAYVTGYSGGIGSNEDYATVKYDTTGAELWVARYNDLVDSTDVATAIALDSSGNAYVTGYSYHTFSGPYADYLTVKYQSATGTQLWEARYNGLADSYDYAYAIAVDSSGNAYVTGSSEGVSHDPDYATVKYSPTGTQLWVVRYNGPVSGGEDTATAIAVDSGGNAYVTGRSEGVGTEFDYATLKYNSSSGAIMWMGLTNGAARYNGTANLNDKAFAIALDSSGNAYVTGESVYNNTGLGKSGMATLKYGSSDGSQAWVATYGGEFANDPAEAIAVLGSNVYITGHMSLEGVNRDDLYATIKYIQQATAPTITAVTSASGSQGQCPLTVVITGANLTGATAVSFGTGITVSSFTVNSATQITATICIDASATPGARNISVSTSGGTATLTGGFTVVQQNQAIGTGAPTSHGSSFSGTTTTTQPVGLPNIVTQSASLSAKTVTPGTHITVTADIANKSAVNGNKKVTLYVNGQVETTQGVTVNSGGSTKLTFNVSRSEPGDYTVYVDGVPAGSFKVEMVTGPDGILIFSTVLVALAFLIGIVMLWRRQRRAV